MLDFTKFEVARSKYFFLPKIFTDLFWSICKREEVFGSHLKQKVIKLYRLNLVTAQIQH